MNIRFLVLFLASLVLIQHSVLASTSEALARLEKAVNDVLAVSGRATNTSSLATDLRPVLTKYISFEAMTKRAVGPGWRQFTPDQQQKATQLFTTRIIRTYSSKLTPGENPQIKYKTATEPAPGRVEIPTTLLYNGSTYQVTYRLEQSDGWRITDVMIEGVSLVANYRTQFDAQFKKGGAEAVINALTQTSSSR